MVYKQITVLPGRHGHCMGRRDRKTTAVHPWFPASDAVMNIDADVNGAWPPLFGRLPLAHLIRRVAADQGRPISFRKRMCLQERESSLWRHVVRCGSAFTPEDFHLKLEDGTLVVSARHERVSPDESGKDVHEMTRNIKVPDDVDTESIRCVHRENGDLVICAHRQNEACKAAEVKPKPCDNKHSNSNSEETSIPESSNPAEETSEKSLECLAEMKCDNSLSAVDDSAIVDSQLFSMDIPISGFEPSEVTVTCRGRTITMCGEKTEASDHGKTYQKWRRQILLPPNVEFERLACCLSQGGKLRLCAPKSVSEQNSPPEEREVPVLAGEHKNGEREVPVLAREHKNGEREVPVLAREHKNGEREVPVLAREHKNGEREVPVLAGEHKNGEREVPVLAGEHKNEEREVPVLAGEHKNGEREVPVLAGEHKNGEREVPVLAGEHKNEEREVPVLAGEHKNEEREVPVLAGEHKNEEREVPVLAGEHKNEEREVPVLAGEHKNEEREVPVLAGERTNEEREVPVLAGEHENEKKVRPDEEMDH